MSPESPFDDTVDTAVRAAARRLDRGSTPISGAEVRARRPSPSRRPMLVRALVAAVAVLSVVGAIVATVWARSDSDDRESAQVRARGDGIDLGPGGCVALAPSPLDARSGQSAVWTGTEMIVWGGYDGRTARDDGAAYDPATRRWRRIAPAPIAARSNHEATWTGTEMLVWGGSTAFDEFVDGAAYDPATDTWRRIPPAPTEPTIRPPSVWTGTEWIIAEGRLLSSSGTGEPPRPPKPRVIAYDPENDRWRRLPSPPTDGGASFADATWTGDQVFFTVDPAFGAFAQEGDAASEALRTVAYSPDSDDWQVVPSIDIQPIKSGGDDTGKTLPSGRVEWTGTEVLVLTGPDFPSYAVDPSTLRTREIAHATSGVPGNLDVWTGHEIVLWSSGLTSAYRPDRDEWSDAVPSRYPAVFVQGESGVWTGESFLVWGGFVNNLRSGGVMLADGVAYRPVGTGGPELECAARQEQAAAAAEAPPSPPAPSAPAEWTEVRNVDARVGISIPPSWREFAPRSNAWPTELLVVGSGDRPSSRAGWFHCATGTSRPRDQSIVIQELIGSPPFGYPTASFDYHFVDRPSDFASGGGGGGVCDGPQGEISSWTWTFREQGRHFMVSAVMGADAGEREYLAMIDVLNTLRVDQLDQSFDLAADDVAAIRTAVAGWLDAPSPSDMKPFIEGYGLIKDQFENAVPLNAEPLRPDLIWEETPYTGRIDEIQGLTPTSARVVFSFLDEQGNAFVDRREGRAVKRNGAWKVSFGTVCGYMALRWSSCPTR